MNSPWGLSATIAPECGEETYMVTLRGGSPPGLSNHPPPLPLALPLDRSLAGSPRRSSPLAHLSTTPAPAHAARGGRGRANPLLCRCDGPRPPRWDLPLPAQVGKTSLCTETAPAEGNGRSARRSPSTPRRGLRWRLRHGPTRRAASGAGRDPLNRRRRRRGAPRSLLRSGSAGRARRAGSGAGLDHAA